MGDSLPDWMITHEEEYHPPRPRRDNERLPRMRERLYRTDPHCFWCGRRVYLNVAHAKPELATVDHLYSRYHPQRLQKYREQDGVLHVLACFKCNGERAACEHRGQPFVPTLAHRLEFAQLADATLAGHSPTKVSTSKAETGVTIDLSPCNELIDTAPDCPMQRLTKERHAGRRSKKVRLKIIRPPMRVICTLAEAVAFARENPAR